MYIKVVLANGGLIEPPKRHPLIGIVGTVECCADDYPKAHGCPLSLVKELAGWGRGNEDRPQERDNQGTHDGHGQSHEGLWCNLGRGGAIKVKYNEYKQYCYPKG